MRPRSRRARVATLGVCPAYPDHGHSCWIIAGTFCDGIAQGSFAQKLGTCLRCEVLRAYSPLDGEHRLLLREQSPAEFERSDDVMRAHRVQWDLHLAKFAIENAGDAILWFTSGGRVCCPNEQAGRLLGYTREELSDLAVAELLPAMGADEWKALWADLQQRQSARFETVYRSKDAVDVPVEVSATYLAFSGGEYLLAIAHDIRPRRELTAQLLQAQKMEAIGQLAGGVAHDFNNMLAVILSYGAFLCDSLDADDPNRKDVVEICAAATRAAQLTRQLLAFSRRQVMEPRLIDVNEVIANLDKMLRRLVGGGIVFELDLRGEARTVLMDPGSLEQVLMNLVVNARDAMTGGGLLTIATGTLEVDSSVAARHPGLSLGSYTTIAVRDTGCGMDAATMARVFEPFFTTKEEGKGTGLGLSTVYGIVKQSDGYVDVTSTVGVGTTFTVMLPARAEQPSPAGTTDPVFRKGGNETILLVEDDAALCSIMRRSLEQAGYRVLAAANAGEALLLFDKHRKDIALLLTNIVMPVLSGVELAERIVKRRARLRVLLTTGHADAAVRGKLGPVDARSVLLKPFAPQTLCAKVREVLDRPRQRTARK